MPLRKRIPNGTRLPVNFSAAERDLIREHTFYPVDYPPLNMLDDATKLVEMNLDEIDDLHGYIAAAANAEESRVVQRKLDRLLVRLETFLDDYDDQE
jgi:hypothetical protein